MIKSQGKMCNTYVFLVCMLSEGKKHKICPSVGRRITRMQTGSLPAASTSSTITSTHSKIFSRRPYTMVISTNYMYSVSLRAFLPSFHVFSQLFISLSMIYKLILFYLNGQLAITWQN
jgi:hypothetical protein